MTDETETGEPEWTEREERGSGFFFEVLIYLYRLIGWRIVVPFIYPVVTYFFLTDSERRNAIFEYFERLYSTEKGKQALGHDPSLWDVYRTYLNFGRVNFDRVALWLGLTEKYEMNFPDRHVLMPYLESSQGVILLSFHVGSFAMMRYGAHSKDLNLHVLAYWENAEQMNRILKKADPDSQMNIFNLDPSSPASMLEIKEKVDSGDFIGMLGDRQSLGSTERVSRVPFLGKKAGFPQGPYLMSYFLECPIILIYCVQTGKRQYDIHARKMTDRVELSREHREEDLDGYVKQYAEAMESVCYRVPHQWFNFFDFWA